MRNARLVLALAAAALLAACSAGAPATAPPSAPPAPTTEGAAVTPAAPSAPDAGVPTPEYPTGESEPLEGPVLPVLPVEARPDPLRVTIVIDAGHGGDDTGAVGFGIVEKESNLDIALRVEALLAEHDDLRVLLTRRTDERVLPANVGALHGFSASRTDLQTRVDIANAAGAAIFVSLHSNAHSDSSLRGVEVYADSLRPFADENEALASAILDGVLGELTAIGRPAVDRGVRDDSCLRQRRGQCRGLFLLSPARVNTREEVLRRGGDPEALGFTEGVDELSTRATEMPAALAELLFVSNARDAAMLQDEPVREAMARGVAAGILAYLEASGQRSPSEG